MAAAPVLAASDYLLQLDGVTAEGTDSAAPQSIEVESFSWGASNAASASSGSGAGAGKVNVQDLSVMKSRTAREASSGMATGKRAAPAADVNGDGRADAVAAAPNVGDVASFTVVTRESPSKGSDSAARGCATGQHFPTAVLVARGQRYEFADVVVTSCSVADGQRKKEFTGHVTLMK
jgi:hypothetical protein